MSSFIFTSQSWGSFGLTLSNDPQVESEVGERRAKLGTLISKSEVVYMRQTHSSAVSIVKSSGEATQIVEADGIVSTDKDVALAVLVGDCIPLLLSSSTVVGAIHIGRKGMQLNIAREAIAVMRSLGAGEIQGLLGPSICANCYEVSTEMYEEISEQIPASATDDASHHLNLQAGVISQLKELGVAAINLGVCTRENEEYFSYRRSLENNTSQGRQVGVVSL